MAIEWQGALGARYGKALPHVSGRHDVQLEYRLPPLKSDSFERSSARSTSVVLFASQHIQASQPATPAEKLNRMASQLAKHNIDAYFLSPEDEHLNEYLPQNKQRITWLTGFHGESAPLVLTPGKMHLFVDGRFHIQVDHE